jgi:HPt (histidine-containing phosphotransfer) domain-containing protein
VGDLTSESPESDSPVSPVPAADAPEPLDETRLAFLERLEILPKVGEMVLETAPGLLDEMRRTLVAGEAGAVEQPAHRLKGSASNLGAQQLARLLGELEALAREENLPGCQRHLGQVEREYVRVAVKLREILRTL